jgi:hypothetical protein
MIWTAASPPAVVDLRINWSDPAASQEGIGQVR